MNRRTFLKCAAAGAAIAGSALAGYELSRFQTSLAPLTRSVTETRTATQTVKETTTETVRLASICGRLFFDCNGVQDGEEPAVAGALVQLKGNAGNVIDEAMTDSSGDYKLEGVRTGSYSLHLGVEHFSDRKFRYMCRSPDEFRAVSDDYPVSLEGSVQVNIGLMEGFLTLPLRSNARHEIGRFYDWDPSESTYLWWNGKRGSTGGGIHGIDPNHIGIDYDIPEGEDVLACAPGVVSHFETGPKGQLGMTIKHAAGDLSIYHSHLSRYVVEPNQKVARGQKVAESGMTGAAYSHLHINNYRMAGNLQQFYDFYAPTFPRSGSLNGYWERKLPDRTDYWKVINEGEQPGGSGFWTVRNDPRFSVCGRRVWTICLRSCFFA